MLEARASFAQVKEGDILKGDFRGDLPQDLHPGKAAASGGGFRHDGKKKNRMRQPRGPDKSFALPRGTSHPDAGDKLVGEMCPESR